MSKFNMAGNLGEMLRNKIQEATSTRSLRSIALEAMIPSQCLYYFVNGQRGISLQTASALIDVVMPNWNSTSEFIYGTELTDRLEYMAQATKNDIKVIGANCYVSRNLEDAVSRGVSYQRLLTSEHLPNGLADHLKNVAKAPNFSLYQTPANCQPMFLTDSEAMLLLPSPSGAVSGVHITGDDRLDNFSKYVDSIIADDRTRAVTEDYRR